jgi:hypothetical protein
VEERGIGERGAAWGSEGLGYGLPDFRSIFGSLERYPATLQVRREDGRLTDHPAALLARARSWVLDLFNQHADRRLFWHNFSRTNELVQLCSGLTPGRELEEEDLTALYTAAWFGFTGWMFDPADPLSVSRQLALQFLHAEHQSDRLRQKVSYLLGMMELGERPGNPTGQVLWDALVALEYAGNYGESQKLRRKEREELAGEPIPGAVWRQQELDRLQGLQCFTAEGKARYEPSLARHMRELERRVRAEQPAASREESVARPSNGNPVSTYFRSAYQTHIHLSAIADRKAQMLLSVNALLISVLISVLSYSNLAETRPMLLIPIMLFLLFGLSSLLFAVLGVRPRVSRSPLNGMPDGERRGSLLFFGHYTQMDADRYVEEMTALCADGAELQKAMHRDLHALGTVLDHKFRTVGLAYNLFLAGAIGGVASFLLVQFLFP